MLQKTEFCLVKKGNAVYFRSNYCARLTKNFNPFILASIFDKKELDFSEFPPTSTEDWESLIKKDLKGENYKEKFLWEEQGFSVLPLYRKENLEDLKSKAVPVFSKSDWEICQPISANSIKEANMNSLLALQNGATGIYFDLPTNLIASYSDLKSLFEDIIIDIIGVQFSTQLSNEKIRSWFWDLVQERGLDKELVNVRFETDTFALGLRTGKLISFSGLEGKVNSLVNESGKALQVDGICFAESGASIVQQVAFALSSLNEILNIAHTTDSLSKTAKTLYLSCSVSSLYFAEIAKLRALRILSTQLINEYGLKDFKSESVLIHAETTQTNKASWDSYNNMLRNSLEAMAAILGGADSLCVHNFDGSFKTSTSFSDRNARNTQLVLQEEAYLNQVADASAGSYYIESLTDSIAKSAWDLFKEIENEGGFYESLKTGKIQSRIKQSRNEMLEMYKSGTKILVGVNKYPPKNPESFPRNKKDYSFFNPESFEEIEKLEPINFASFFEKEGLK